jgi:hypothetical protein
MKAPAASVFLVVSLCAVPPASRTAATSRPAPEKHTLRQSYRPGRELLLRRRIRLEVVRDDHPRINRRPGKAYHHELKAHATFDVRVRTRRIPDANDARIEASFRRFRATVEGTDGTGAVDTGRPTAATAGEPPTPLKRWAALKGIALKAKQRPDGAIIDVTGARAYTERFEQVCFPSSRPEERRRRAASFTKAFRASFGLLLAEPFAYLPAQPVAVGQSWHVKRDLTQHELWDTPGWFVKETVKCTLAEVKRTREGRVAIIRLSGTWTVPECYRPAGAALSKTGEIHLDLDRGTLRSHRVEVLGELPMHSEILTGGPLVLPLPKAPRTGTETFKFAADVELLEPRAASRPAAAGTVRPGR